MSDRDWLKKQIESLSEESLGELKRWLQSRNQPAVSEKIGIFEQLEGNRFDGPSDFSENFAAYASGEKSFD